MNFKSITSLLIITSFVVGREDIIDIDAFSYVPSPKGEFVAYFYYSHRPKSPDDDIKSPIGGCILQNIYRNQRDTFALDGYIHYYLEKDGINWVNDSEFVFTKYYISGRKISKWLYKDDDPYDVRTMHFVNQTSISPNGKYKAYWLLRGMSDTRNLIVEGGGALDTIFSLNEDEEQISGALFYKNYWVDNERLIFGSHFNGKNVLYLFNKKMKGITSADTIDHCYYRLHNDHVYYLKDSNLVEKDLQTNESKMVCTGVDGEFDVSKKGIIYSDNGKIYLKRNITSEVQCVAKEGFAPRWLGEKKSIIYAVKINGKHIIKIKDL